MTFFHGTRRGFGRGGYLFPRTFHGGEGTAAPVNSGQAPSADADGWVYLTEEIDLAWAYAYAAPGRGKPKVLEVEPYGVVEPDPEHGPRMKAWRCNGSARVVRVLTEPTMTEAEAQEGWMDA